MNPFAIHLMVLAWVRRISLAAYLVMVLAFGAFGAVITHSIATQTIGLLFPVTGAAVLAITLALAYTAWKAVAIIVLRDYRKTGNVFVDILEWIIFIFFMAPLYGTGILIKYYFGDE